MKTDEQCEWWFYTPLSPPLPSHRLPQGGKPPRRLRLATANPYQCIAVFTYTTIWLPLKKKGTYLVVRKIGLEGLLY